MVDTLLLSGATVATASMIQAVGVETIYVNRARRKSDGAHIYWVSVNAPDPEMRRVLPAVTSSDYEDIVWVKDRCI